MKSNKPITLDVTKPSTFDEAGNVLTTETKEVLFDRLGIQMSIGMSEGKDSAITQSVAIRFKKCSLTGEITNEGEVSVVIPNIMECKDVDAQICVEEMIIALSKYKDKKGL